MRLLHKSNPTLFEWNSSPIVYRTTEDWQRLSATINEYLLEKAGLYHYLSTAKKNYREYLKGETVRLKKYFYVLRPLLACRWIMAEETPPPMLFSELMDKYLDEEVKPDVQELLRLKMETQELGEGKRMDRINEYLDRGIEEIGQMIEKLPPDRARPWEDLNNLFLSTVLKC